MSDFVERLRELAFRVDDDGNMIIKAADEIGRLRAENAELRAENAELLTLAKASLDARNAEAKADMTLQNAEANFHVSDQEKADLLDALILADNADRALRNAIEEMEKS